VGRARHGLAPAARRALTDPGSTRRRPVGRRPSSDRPGPSAHGRGSPARASSVRGLPIAFPVARSSNGGDARPVPEPCGDRAGGRVHDRALRARDVRPGGVAGTGRAAPPAPRRAVVDGASAAASLSASRRMARSPRFLRSRRRGQPIGVEPHGAMVVPSVTCRRRHGSSRAVGPWSLLLNLGETVAWECRGDRPHGCPFRQAGLPANPMRNSPDDPRPGQGPG
jgi:hypothetical protein